MRRNKTIANPSRLKSLVDAFNKGLCTEAELLRLKKEALGINVYTGKAKNVSRRQSNNNTNRNTYSFSSLADSKTSNND